MIKRDENGKSKFDPVGLIRVAIEIVIILASIGLFLSGIKSDLSVQANEIAALKQCDIRLEKKIDDNKTEREAQLNKMEIKLDKIYELLLEK